MILDALLGLAMMIVDGLLGLLPDIEPPDLVGAVESIEGIAAYTGWLNKYFPVAEAIVILGLVVSIYTVMYVVQLAMWVYSKLPFVGS